MMSASLLQSRTLLHLQKHIPNSWKKGLIYPLNHPQLTQQPTFQDSQAASPPFEPLNDPKENPPITTPNSQEISLDSLLSSIKIHSLENQLSKAFDAFSLLQHHPSSSSFHLLHPIFSLILCCTYLKVVPQGKQLHAHILSLGLQKDPLLLPKLVSFYSTLGHLSDAHLVVGVSDSCHVLPWNFLISAYVRHGFCGDALLAYKQMVKKGVKADNFTYPSVLKACGDEFDLDLGREVHRSVNTSGLEWNLFVQNSLIGMYVKCGLLEEARTLFDSIPHRDVVSWNSIISGYASKGMWEEVFALFERMRTGCTDVNIMTLNIIAGGNVQVGNYAGALNLISHMRSTGLHLDSVTFVIGLAACARTGFLKLGKAIHGLAIRSGCDEGESIKNALISMYSRCNHLRHAYVLFRAEETQNVVTWNCMISGCSFLEHFEEAAFLFREMVSSGVHPNYVTIASTLPLCARIANLQHGKEIHCYIIKHNFEEYLLIWNALVDMYSKSGRIVEAKRVFDSMGERDKVSYTSLIAGYGIQGEGQIGLMLFDEMNKCRIKPDHITMVAVLSACSHSGLLAQGQIIFGKMVTLYGLTPKMEHYACMVDLYGRAGLLWNAREILTRMPLQPSPAMWATLIGACRIHGDMEIGEWAAGKLLEMRPKNPGYYVLIANMYAAVGCWSKLAEVRILMRDSGLRKAPGCAWIDVGSGYSLFLVGDRSNPQAREVYLLLEGLIKHLKDVGYVVNADLALEDD